MKVFHPADAFHDQLRNADICDDIFVAGEIPLREEKDSAIPVEETVNDVSNLVLNPFPELLGRDGAHFNKNLSLPLVLAQLGDGSCIVIPGDPSPCKQQVSEPLFGQIAGGKNPISVLN